MGMGSSDMADTTRRFKYAFPSRHGMLFFAAALLCPLPHNCGTVHSRAPPFKGGNLGPI